MTSLEQQLKRLKTAQTEEFVQQRYRASFLYDKKDAAAIDCETHLRIASKAFKRLLKLDESLEKYADIFSEDSKTLERSALTEEENDRLSARLRGYLNSAVAPFFMLNDCLESFEYLIYKYHVHTYQSDDLLCAILPYHETKLFARALQLFDDLADSPTWSWLEPYKKEGVPVPKERILATLASRSKLPLVALLGDKLLEINKDSSQPERFTSFYTVMMMGVLDGRDLDERFFVLLMAHVYKAIKKAKTLNLYLAALVLVGYLAYTQELDETFLNNLIERLGKTHAKLRERQTINRELLDEYQTKVLTVLKK